MVSGLALSRLGCVLGGLLLVAGVFLAFGLAAALLAAGVLVVAASLLLVDVGAPAPAAPRRRGLR